MSAVRPIATVTTNMGIVTMELFSDLAPATVANFTKLANTGFYNGTRFHRIIAGFMIQGGDPQSADPELRNRWGTGGPGYQFADEIYSGNNNCALSISMANAGPNTNGSQFFINVADNDFLDTKHTVFGKVSEGADVVREIAGVPTGPNDQPRIDVVVESISVA